MSLNASGHPGKAQWQSALGDVQGVGVVEGGDDGGADRGLVGEPAAGPAGGGFGSRIERQTGGWLIPVLRVQSPGQFVRFSSLSRLADT
jgi:hypothetical protein